MGSGSANQGPILPAICLHSVASVLAPILAVGKYANATRTISLLAPLYANKKDAKNIHLKRGHKRHATMVVPHATVMASLSYFQQPVHVTSAS